jgi:hypothetical protein
MTPLREQSSFDRLIRMCFNLVKAVTPDPFKRSPAEPARTERVLLAIAVRLMSSSERDRYSEEFRAELLDVPGDTRLSHVLSLLRGVFVLRLRRGSKKEAADASVRRLKS